MPAARPILWMPPKMTAAVANAMVRPVTVGGTPKVTDAASATEFDCTMLPIPKAAIAANTANRVPNHGAPTPSAR
jgi:hypothetical protein